MSFRTAAKSPNALMFEDAVFLKQFLKSSKEVRRYRTSESDTQACGKGAVLSPIVDDVHARRHVAEPRPSRQVWRMAKSQDSGHDLDPQKLLWKLDEVIVGFRMKKDAEIG